MASTTKATSSEPRPRETSSTKKPDVTRSAASARAAEGQVKRATPADSRPVKGRDSILTAASDAPPRSSSESEALAGGLQENYRAAERQRSRGAGPSGAYDGPIRAARQMHGQDHNHDHAHGNDNNHYWVHPLPGTKPPPDWGKLPENPPPGLSEAEKKLWEFRRERGPEHEKWHNNMPPKKDETGAQKVEFFDFHRQLVENDNKERERLGLPPLGPMDPPPPESLCPRGPDGKPTPDPEDPSKMLDLKRPDPYDEKYKGNFEAFYNDMRRYHDLYHGMNPDIGHSRTNIMEDKFYQFHAWIEQQYQNWRENNPDWKPPA